MATEASLFPMDISTMLNQDQSLSGNLQDDPFLQELIKNEGNDFLTAFFDTTTTEVLNQGTAPIGASLDSEPFQVPISPVGSEGYASESSRNVVNSPAASLASTGGVSFCDQQSEKSPSSSPKVTSGFPDVPWLSSPTNGNERKSSSSDLSQWPSPPNLDVAKTSDEHISSDVRIDVDYMMLESIGGSDLAASESSPSSRKAPTLVLTDEEKRLLSEEGITLPTDMPLTKAEQRNLKRIRRKIKNKISAQESRKRKKDYVEGLEDRVKLSTERNQQLADEVDKLKSHNQFLTKQLKQLQEWVAKFYPSKSQAGTAGTMLMVLVLSFSLFFVPKMSQFTPGGDKLGYQVANGFARQTRTLLFAETDQFGNVIDPKTGKVITVVGGKTPMPLPPWLDQTPVINKWMNNSRLQRAGNDMLTGKVPSNHQRSKTELKTPPTNHLTPSPSHRTNSLDSR